MYIRVLHNVYIYIVDIHCGVWGFVDARRQQGNKKKNQLEFKKK